MQKYVLYTLEKLIKVYKKRQKKCSAYFSEDSVHDVRVVIRRLATIMSLIEQFEPNQYIKPARKMLKTQLKHMNPLRDTQVQMLKVDTLIHSEPVLFTFFLNLKKNEELYILSTRKNLQKFDMMRLDGLLLFSKLALKTRANSSYLTLENIVNFAKSLFEKVCLSFDSATPNDLNTIHKVRLAFKKFRYVMEFLSTVHGFEYLKKLQFKNFQDTLGLIQDNNVLINNLNEFINQQTEIPTLHFNSALQLLLSEREKLISDFFNTRILLCSFWNDKKIKQSMQKHSASNRMNTNT